MSAVSQFTVMYIVLAATIALDDANDDEQEDEEGKSENHADEPSGSGNAVVSLWHDHDILKREFFNYFL